MSNYFLANERQRELRQEAAHDRLVAGLSPQPRNSVLAPVQRALTRGRALVADLGTTRPIRRRVRAWIG